MYLGYCLSFANFVLIAYRLFWEKLTNQFFAGLWQFALVFAFAYIPACIVAGHMHKKKQLRVDQQIIWEETPIVQEILRRLERIEEKLDEK